ncbi:MAG: RNA polymerase sigma factor [Minisyncoccota bacterium]
MEKTDEALVAEYLAGNEDAFATLVERHVRSVYSFVARSVGSEAEDIVQDTFLKVWKNLKKYEPRSAKFKTWLMRIARNTVIDYLRRKKSFVFSNFENARDDSRILDTPDTEHLPDELVARAHDARDVEMLLEKLSPVYREVLLLRYMSQMSFEEISQVLGESANTVRSRHRRGLAQLRQLFNTVHRNEK